MRILIIDDNMKFAEKLRLDLFNYISLQNDRTDFTLVTEAFDVIESNKNYDVVFLDIDLPNNNGIEIAKKLQSFKITDKLIFITSYAHLVFDALSVHPYFFVRKNEYEKDMKIVYELFSSNSFDQSFINLKTNRQSVMINLKKIIYIESCGHKLIITTTDQTYEDSSRTMKQFLQEITQDCFVQIHKSFVINLDCLEKYDNMGVYLTGGKHIQFGKKYKDLFLNKYMEYLVK